MKAIQGVAIGICAPVILAGVVIGGYQGGWWLQKNAQNQNARIRRSSYEAQTTFRDEMVRKIGDVKSIDVQLVDSDTPQLRAQRTAIVAIVCADNSRIQGGLDESTAAFVAKECS